MDSTTQKHVGNLRSEDRELQNQAFSYILQETEKPVDWAYEVWDQLVEGLRHKDNHVRAISAQILANLAKSDPKNRMQKDFPALMAVTGDDKFVTARHTLQSIWKVGREKKMQKTVVVRVERRVRDAMMGKTITRSRKYHAHVEEGQFGEGDLVEIAECRPISRTKSWRVTKLVEKSKAV